MLVRLVPGPGEASAKSRPPTSSTASRAPLGAAVNRLMMTSLVMRSHRPVGGAFRPIAAAVLVALTVALPAALAQTLPRVGWEVSLTFLEGDADGPVVIGALWNSVDQPPARARLEGDLRRAVATRKLEVSSAEIAGAVSRALDLVAHHKAWTEATKLRGCGPARKLCFVVTCRGCGGP